MSRLIKRRTVAKEFCDQGKVKVNGRAAKPSLEVKTGDVVEFQMGPRHVKVEVLVSGEGPVPRNVTEAYRTLE